MAGVTILVGAQWGDEGKGKWIDILAEKTDLVARFQGGNNAGHTLYINGVKTVLHQIPSGIFHANQICALSAGVVINPTQLVAEINKIKPMAQVSPDRLWLSVRAHVITPWHIELDCRKEAAAKSPIGTTKRGIGPTYADKYARIGLRLGHYVDDNRRRAWLDQMISTNGDFKSFWEQNRSLWEEFEAAATILKPFVRDAETDIRKAVSSGKTMLLEGAQGTLLDIDHGTYPFVTSSSTAAGGAMATIGLGAKQIGRVIGIAKAYTTRVGSGPFPTELKDDIGAEIAKRGNEFGATTGRPRRCGYYDAVAMRYAAAVNGFDGIIVNKIDILTGFKELKIAVAYKHPKLGTIKDFPWDEAILADCTPVYETFPGWNEDIPSSGKISDLPANALKYIKAIEEHSGTKVLMVGTGVGRQDALYA